MSYSKILPTIKRTVILVFLNIICAVSLMGAQPTEILWDKYGVPHIFGKTKQEMYHAYGWAQMHNHADLILKLYGQSRGRGAEYWGEKYLETDKKIVLFEIPDYARENYQLQEEPYKSYLDAFVMGVNKYAETHPDAISEEYRQVLPVTGIDVMAHVLRVLCLEFVAWDDFNTIERRLAPGSNAIAIAPSRSASGNAMLVTNPHLAWSDMHLWFEAHLTSPGFNAYGITLVGAPTLSMAFNEHLGWAFTVNPMDGADTYELSLHRKGYRMDRRVRQFVTKNKTLKVRQSDGSHRSIETGFRYSVHGPVTGEKDGKALALRLVGLSNYRIFEQYHRMSAASNLDEFEDAMKLLQNPMFNIIYADCDGNIFYLFNGNVPVRPEGDHAFWKGIIDGTKSKYLWNTIHTYDELPKLVNPPAGFIQNCNDGPWVSTYPSELDPSLFPSYMASHSMTLRPQRALNLIRKNPSISFDQLIGYKMDSGMEAADRFLDDLLNAVRQFPNPEALEAARVLENWDGKTNAGSTGAVLFARWFDMLGSSGFEIRYDPKDPVNTPRGLKEPEKAVEILVRASTDLKKRYGAQDIPWGDIHRIRLNDIDLPASGGGGRYGILHTMEYMDDHDGKRRVVFGETYIAVTEFGDPVRAMVLLGYGNATQSGSIHAGDQLEYMAAGKLRPALLNRHEILENLEKKEIIFMVPVKSGFKD
jgi:acyl-homoserine-lactone acylase